MDTTDNPLETGATKDATPKNPLSGRDKRGRFAKGAPSANPRGRPVESHEMKALARDKTAEAIKRLVFWLRSDDPAASVAAAKELLSRGYGKPEQSIAVDATVTERTLPAWEDMDPVSAAAAYAEMVRADGPYEITHLPSVAPYVAAPPPATLSPPPPESRARPPEVLQAPTSAEPPTPEQEFIPAEPAPSSTRELWEKLGRPANPEEALSALDAVLRQAHVHRPLADSICPGCKALWVNS